MRVAMLEINHANNTKNKLALSQVLLEYDYFWNYTIEEKQVNLLKSLDGIKVSV